MNAEYHNMKFHEISLAFVKLGLSLMMSKSATLNGGFLASKKI
jgi:hypothetical protein